MAGDFPFFFRSALDVAARLASAGRRPLPSPSLVSSAPEFFFSVSSLLTGGWRRGSRAPRLVSFVVFGLFRFHGDVLPFVFSFFSVLPLGDASAKFLHDFFLRGRQLSLDSLLQLLSLECT